MPNPDSYLKTSYHNCHCAPATNNKRLFFQNNLPFPAGYDEAARLGIPSLNRGASSSGLLGEAVNGGGGYLPNFSNTPVNWVGLNNTGTANEVSFAGYPPPPFGEWRITTPKDADCDLPPFPPLKDADCDLPPFPFTNGDDYLHPLPTVLPKAYGVNQSSTLWGDPHIADADRADKTNDKAVSFDVTEAGLYNILEDRGVQLNAKFEKFPQWGPTVTTEIGLNLNGAKILVSADGTTTVNGSKLMDGQKTTLPNGATITKSGLGLKIATNPDSGEYDIEITAIDSGHKNDAGSTIFYLDTKISSRSKGVGQDGVAPKGILGEGFDEDSVERKALKLTSPDKYKVTTLVSEYSNTLPLAVPIIKDDYFKNLPLLPIKNYLSP
jgi:hypothetical protein